jgi:hypothetical protein
MVLDPFKRNVTTYASYVTLCLVTFSFVRQREVCAKKCLKPSNYGFQSWPMQWNPGGGPSPLPSTYKKNDLIPVKIMYKSYEIFAFQRSPKVGISRGYILIAQTCKALDKNMHTCKLATTEKTCEAQGSRAEEWIMDGQHLHWTHQ